MYCSRKHSTLIQYFPIKKKTSLIHIYKFLKSPRHILKALTSVSRIVFLPFKFYGGKHLSYNVAGVFIGDNNFCM